MVGWLATLIPNLRIFFVNDINGPSKLKQAKMTESIKKSIAQYAER